MDVIIFVSLIILLLVLMSNQSSLIKRFDKTDRTAEKLEVKVTALMQEIASLKHPDALPLQNTVKPVSGESIQHSIAPPEEPVKEYKQYVPPVVKVPAPAPIKPKGEPAISIPPVQQLKTESIKKEVVPPKPSFMERNPDLEKFIGENLINKIGIGILVLGIGFFVKFAIDQ
ncbi:MAG: DUF2339 domain-containing protein, partial [Cytophagales bacterium]|nr:DUF2339 domain-containing protein [Cytophaga sp.]